MAGALEANDTLLELSLINTGLSYNIGKLLLEVLEKNKTLLVLDVCHNPELNPLINRIQERLIANQE